MKISAKSRRYVLFVFLAGIFVWLLFVFFRPFEPRYGGKRLSQWAAIFSEWPPQEFQQATNAILHIGTNALPYAVQCCQARLLGIDLDQPSGFITADRLHQQSIGIFSLLGPAAKPAIPALVKALHSRNTGVANTAAEDLSAIGPAAIGPFVEMLTDSNVQVRRWAAAALEFLPTPKSAVPALELRLKDEDSLVRANAALALGRFGTNSPATVVQALLNALQTETNFMAATTFLGVLGMIKKDAPLVVPAIVRYMQRETNNWLELSGPIHVLELFGTNAKPAVPVLVNLLESNPQFPSPESPAGYRRAWVLGALEKIDPETAKPFVEKWKASMTNLPLPNAVERAK